MRFDTSKSPLIYLISAGNAINENFAESSNQFLKLIKIAIDCQLSLVQIREKQLSANQIFELTSAAARITKDSQTLLLVNDRADIALAAQANGVHLTANSIPPAVIRRNFPKNFVIGVSTHSIAEIFLAKNATADFATFSPIFSTPSKTKYNLPPQGTTQLFEACRQAQSFPIIALGGIDESNLKEICATGASGIAAIRFLNDAQKLPETIEFVRQTWKNAASRQIK